MVLALLARVDRWRGGDAVVFDESMEEVGSGLTRKLTS